MYPNVVGRTPLDAKRILDAANVNYCEVLVMEGATVKNHGTVIEQTENSHIPTKHYDLMIKVSSCPVIPSVIGMTKEEATKVIVESTFTVGDVLYDGENDEMSLWVVTSQSPYGAIHYDTYGKINLIFSKKTT